MCVCVCVCVHAAVTWTKPVIIETFYIVTIIIYLLFAFSFGIPLFLGGGGPYMLFSKLPMCTAEIFF